MDYLSTKAKIQNYDVIAFEEAWDRDSRNKIKTNLAKNYPYSLDPVPINTHGALLNSGLLVLSKYPIIESKYIDYLDYQYLVDADKFTNKGAIYFKINKKGRDYNLIVTHTQAQDDSSAISTRQQEFNLIYNYLIKDANLNISPKDPLILMGDLNTDYYTSSQYNYMKAALNLNDSWIKNTIYTDPIYSYDPKLNLMIDSSITVQGLYDYLIPLNGYLLPQKVDYQIIPIRAVDYAPMYQKSHNEKLYSYGDVETSDHFMLQGRFFFSNESAD